MIDGLHRAGCWVVLFPFLTILLLAVLALAGLDCWRRIAADRSRTGEVGPTAARMIWSIYLSFTALTIAVAWYGVWPLPLNVVPAAFAGAAVVLIGLALLGAGMTKFGSVARMSGRMHGELISAGIYRWSRNPQNLGWGLALIGIALLGRSGLALLFAAIFFLAFRVYVPVEERFMRTIFGDEWLRYERSTSRFFGLPAVPNSAAPVKVRFSRLLNAARQQR
jgi:protein-S-isoprenylcysteine O-methyltransferase Ste14